tara:strand:+ start:265 stop:495 length:231 start_codon:yes stop_codon:yes gene_type:complete
MIKKIICFIVGTFILVYLFQTLDKKCKRKTLFDKIKVPLLTSCLIGILVMHLSENPMVIPQTKIDGQEIFTDLANF